ncbi:MAG: glycine zipper domain-containing protein, partial [Opitutaceae bacterium]
MKTSKLPCLVLTSALFAVLLAACASPPRPSRGTVIGAATGAAIGGVIGNQSDETEEGALIGAAVG